MPKFKDWIVSSISEDRLALRAIDVKTDAFVHVWLRRATLRPLSGAKEVLHSNAPIKGAHGATRHTTRSLTAKYGLAFMAEAKAVIRDGSIINNAIVAETRREAEQKAAEQIAALKHRKMMAGPQLYAAARAIFKSFAQHLPPGARDVESWARDTLAAERADDRTLEAAKTLVDAAQLFREIEHGGPAEEAKS